MASKAERVTLTGSSSVRQLALYQSWPAFSFVDSIYGTGKYILANRTGEESGTIGVIDRHFKKAAADPPIWTQHNARPTPSIVTAEPMLGSFIANMVAPSACGRQSWAGGQDDWSKVVDVLLSVTYGKVFRHKAALGKSTPRRGVTALAYLLTTSAMTPKSRSKTGSDWRPPFDGFEVIEDPLPGGISLVHIRIGQSGDS
jgi:hypothetical protein